MRFKEHLKEEYFISKLINARDKNHGIVKYNLEIFLNPSPSEIKKLKIEFEREFGSAFCKFIIDFDEENVFVFNGLVETHYNIISFLKLKGNNILCGDGIITKSGKIEPIYYNLKKNFYKNTFAEKYFEG